jgi:hypothetical protein
MPNDTSVMPELIHASKTGRLPSNDNQLEKYVNMLNTTGYFSSHSKPLYKPEFTNMIAPDPMVHQRLSDLKKSLDRSSNSRLSNRTSSYTRVQDHPKFPQQPLKKQSEILHDMRYNTLNNFYSSGMAPNHPR